MKLDQNMVFFEEYNRDTNTYSADYFTAWMDHSENGNGANGGFIFLCIITRKSVDETTEYAANSDIEIIHPR